MSDIHDDARQYVNKFGDRAQQILTKFTEVGFSIKYASKFPTHGSELIFAFLSADNDLKAIFGFEYEVLLVYSRYTTLEARTFLGIEHYMSSSPARGRVESLMYILVSECPNTDEWVESYLLENKDERIAIPFNSRQLIQNRGTKIIDIIKRKYSAINKFKDNLPIETDSYFFGREAEMKQALESYKRKENIGIFGLRKTGKTSLLLKINRVLKDEKNVFIFIQLQDPQFGLLRWNELLKYVATKLSDKKYNFSPKNASRSLGSALRDCLDGGKERVTILIDEIEQITPGMASEEHWNQDYSRFFQAIRALQTEMRAITLIIAGLSSYCIDKDRLYKKQNPLFGLASPIFLKGFSESETINMVNKLSKVSSAKFHRDAVVSIFQNYGGHPLLTRLACSFELEHARLHGNNFPETISLAGVEQHSELRDRELIFYIKHIVSELDEYYHDEYLLLENLALGNIVEFNKKTKTSTFGRYLYNYGIVKDENDTPFITIKVVSDYLVFENARINGRPTFFPIVEQSLRDDFVKSRIDSIINDMRLLENKIRRRHGRPLLFGPNSFPHADRLVKVVAPADWDDFHQNIDPFHLAFVESIDVYGESIGSRNYFWNEIKENYPILYKALHRIRVYRNNSNHLRLVTRVNEQLEFFLKEDLAGTGEEIPEKYWVIFQRILDELMRAIQFEDSRLK